MTERMLGKRGWGSVWLNRHLRAETEADWDDVTATNRLLCLGGACRTVTADWNWVPESLHCWKLHAKRYTLCTYISQTYKVFAKFFYKVLQLPLFSRLLSCRVANKPGCIICILFFYYLLSLSSPVCGVWIVADPVTNSSVNWQLEFYSDLVFWQKSILVVVTFLSPDYCWEAKTSDDIIAVISI